eukprot:CAMPEP_0182438750 /NCGR_PEP_ID=MMETSP1167-20130531/85996_1 /TAXON_ID=2988 /ORGANISM="Mallomonas Sp, Strain CCMP3275" /LENGTH=415 /DNA_ID=CAMNT_0024632255 /DNA_START=80 /DNA_END=1327 /DNA_ORIENTATION=-
MTLNRSFGYTDVIEKTIGKQVVNKLADSVGLDHLLEESPRSSASDPSKPLNWEWGKGLESNPKLSKQDMSQLMKSSEDPFHLVEKDISTLAGSIKELLGSDHPVLESCAKYFFNIDGGKKIRPTMVLLMSYALNAKTSAPELIESDMTASPSQRRLAEITEMIHTASLFHDDVIDKAATRRGAPSVNQVFGDKLAILGGDFLLSRASVALARLRNLDVVELLSLVIEHLVKGEIMQMKPPTPGNSLSTASSPELLHYLHKNFFKTASLMGNSCLASAVLENESVSRCRAAYLYGVHAGQAFQLIDDALDFEGSLQTIGKAPLADLQSGLATAPVLFAAQEFPQELSPLIARKFEEDGDVEKALSYVTRSAGIERTKALAQVHAEIAIDAVMRELTPSPARDALVSLACKIVTRER